jgi:hypothetical protein
LRSNLQLLLYHKARQLKEAAKVQKEQDRAPAGAVNELSELDRQAWSTPYYEQIEEEAAVAEERERAGVEARRKQDALDAWLCAGGRRDEFKKAWPEIFQQMLIADSQRTRRRTSAPKPPVGW